MSTRSTLKYGDGFHLYTDFMDDEDTLHLQLDGAAFTVTERGVDISIPLSIWEVIRHTTLPNASLDLADLSDEELKQRVKEKVDKRINASPTSAPSSSDRSPNPETRSLAMHSSGTGRNAQPNNSYANELNSSRETRVK